MLEGRSWLAKHCKDPRQQPLASLVMYRCPSRSPMSKRAVRIIHHAFILIPGAGWFLQLFPGQRMEIGREVKASF